MQMLRGIAGLSAVAMAALGGQAVIAGLAGIIASLSQMAGLLLLIPAMVNAIAAPIAGLAIGFSGITGAFQAMAQEAQNAEQTSKAVAAAQKQVVAAEEGVETAIEGVARAEKAAQRASEQHADARDDLTRALKTAKERMEDLQLTMKGAALSEEDAVLGVLRAEENLRNMPKGSTALDYREADLALRQAKLRLEEIKESNGDLREEYKETMDKGVEGADEVVAAKRRVRDAAEAEKEAQQDIVRANEQVVKANQQLAEAMQAVADAAKGTGELQKAMDKLSPSAQEFVRAIHGLGPAWSETRKFIQEKLFAGLASDVVNLANVYMPALKDGLGGINGALNGMAKDVIKAFAAPDAVEKFAVVMDRVRNMIEIMRPGIFALVGVWKNLATVGSEFFARFATGFTNGAQRLERWSMDFDNIRGIIERAIQSTLAWWTVLKNVGGIIGAVFRQANGQETVERLGAALGKLREDMNSLEAQNSFARFFAEGNHAITLLQPILTQVILGLADLGGMLAGLGAAIAPGVLDFITGLREGIQNLQPAFDVIGPKISALFSALGENMPGLGNALSSLIIAFSPYIDLMTILAHTLLPTVISLLERFAPIIAAMAPVIIGLVAAWKLLAVAMNIFGAVQGVLGFIQALKTLGVFTKIATALQKAWNIVMIAFNVILRANPIGLIITALTALVAGIVLAYQNSETFRNIVQSVWEAIKTAISVAWESVIKPVWNALLTALKAIGDFFVWVWDTLIKPAWTALSEGIKWWVENVTIPAFNFIMDVLGKVGDFFKWVWNEVIKPAWEALGNGIKWVIDNFIHPAFEGLKDGLGKVRDFFGTVVDAIGTIWDKIKELAAKPINFVIDTVYNKGILPAWNAVAGLIGMDDKKLQPMEPVKFAKGGIYKGDSALGVMSGYSPGRDDRLIAVGGGEGILRPELTRALGADWVNRGNQAARHGGVGGAKKFLGAYANGGIVDSIVGIVRDKFPMMSITSTLRSTPDLHGQGKAVDVSNGGTAGTPEMKGVAKLFYQNYAPDLAELIHWPLAGWNNIDEGKPFNFGQPTNDQHRDHVHIASHRALDPAKAGINADQNWWNKAWDGITGAVGGAVEWVRDKVADLFEKPMRALGSKIPDQVLPGSDGGFSRMPKMMYNGLVDKAINFVRGKADEKDAANGAVSMGPIGETQQEVAKQIIESARSHGLGKEGSEIGIMTGLAESGLRVLANRAIPESLNMPNHGVGADHDSVGVFQQRPSWGSLAQRMNPRASADMFFNALKQTNWRGIDPWLAAQGVQRSAFSDGSNYRKYFPQAKGMVAELFDNGGWLKPGTTMVQNKTGAPEPVFTGGQWDVLKQGLNWQGANEWAANQKFEDQFRDWGREAIKEVGSDALSPLGLGGEFSRQIDNIFNMAAEAAAKAAAEAAIANSGINDGKIADEVNFYGMDPQKVTEEINRDLAARGNYTSRYRNG